MDPTSGFNFLIPCINSSEKCDVLKIPVRFSKKEAGWVDLRSVSLEHLYSEVGLKNEMTIGQWCFVMG